MPAPPHSHGMWEPHDRITAPMRPPPTSPPSLCQAAWKMEIAVLINMSENEICQPNYLKGFAEKLVTTEL